MRHLLCSLLCVAIAAAAGCSDGTRLAEPVEAPIVSGLAPPILILCHADEGSISIFDTTQGESVGTIKIADRIGPVALSGDGQRAYVSTPDAIAVVDVPARKVLSTIPMTGERSSLVPAGNVLYVIENTSSTSKGKVSALDLPDGRVRFERTIDDLAGAAVLSADGRRLFIPHHFYSGRVTVLEIGRLVTRSMTFEDGAKRPALASDDRRLYVPNGSTFDGRVTVIDTATYKPAADIELAGEPTDIILSPDGRRGYVPMFREDQIAVLDLASHKVERTIPVFRYPLHVALSSEGSMLYILHNTLTELSLIDVKTWAVTTYTLVRPATDIVRPGRFVSR